MLALRVNPAADEDVRSAWRLLTWSGQLVAAEALLIRIRSVEEEVFPTTRSHREC
jgi:hypothetical protein